MSSLEAKTGADLTGFSAEPTLKQQISNNINEREPASLETIGRQGAFTVARTHSVELEPKALPKHILPEHRYGFVFKCGGVSPFVPVEGAITERKHMTFSFLAEAS